MSVNFKRMISSHRSPEIQTRSNQQASIESLTKWSIILIGLVGFSYCLPVTMFVCPAMEIILYS